MSLENLTFIVINVVTIIRTMIFYRNLFFRRLSECECLNIIFIINLSKQFSIQYRHNFVNKNQKQNNFDFLNQCCY